MRNMKDSGIEWIGDIPENWDLPKVKHLFSIGRGRVIGQTELKYDGLYPVYSSQTKNNGCLGYIDTYDFDITQLTWTTDGANAGTVFLREGKHNCTNVCGTLTPKNNDNQIRYLKYSLEYIAIYHKRADTNGYKIMNNEMSEIKITLPPLEEQELIADYLDNKVKEIDNIISKTQETIEEYKKYKQSVITEAVTKGLNPDVEMKDSGIEWIGEIPKHWQVNKIKNFYNVICGSTPKSQVNSYWDGEIIWVTPSDYKTDDIFITSSKRKITENGLQSCGTTLVPKHSIIISNRAPIGSVCIANTELCTNQGCKSLVSKSNSINYKLMYYYISIMEDILNVLGRGTTFLELSTSDLSNFNILLLPREEQDKIVEYLDKKCIKIDSIITKKQELITQLESYKKSLIYEYVTGKKEVNVAYGY